MPIIPTLFTFVSTLLGGLVSVRFRSKMHILLGFTAGVILGLIAFDLMPEIFNLLNETGVSPLYPMTAFVAGILIFHSLEQFFRIHHAQEERYARHSHPFLGQLSASALVLHSFFDGVGIGLGFQVSTSVGILVAVAVISHDFSDGLNTGSLMLMHGNKPRQTWALILADAAAPIVGAASTLLFTLPERFLLVYLGFFAGFLLYISLEDILPEAHCQHSSVKPTSMTVLGLIFIFVVTRIV